MARDDSAGGPATSLPWDHYNKIRLRPGTSYPVGQGEVELGLTVAGIRVGELIMFRRDLLPGHRKEDRDRVPLLSAEWDGSKTQLWVYAVPSGRRARVHGLMVKDALPAAYRWLANVPDRGNAWSAIRHSFVLSVNGDSLTIDET